MRNDKLLTLCVSCGKELEPGDTYFFRGESSCSSCTIEMGHMADIKEENFPDRWRKKEGYIK